VAAASFSEWIDANGEITYLTEFQTTLILDQPHLSAARRTP
jgi:hypothetical protein